MLFRDRDIDSHCRIKFSLYDTPTAAYLGQGNWPIATKRPEKFTYPDESDMRKS